MYQYFIKVKLSFFRTEYVEYIDWDAGVTYYTKDFHMAGDFGSYERALEVKRFLELDPYHKSVEIIEY